MNQIDRMIQDDWASRPDVGDACARIWRALSGRQTQLDHYTFFDLQKFAGDVAPDAVAQALLYLCNPRLRVLRTCLMYEDDGYFLELPVDEIDAYTKGEEIIHPRFGTPLPQEEVLVCFTAGDAPREGVAR